MFLNLNKENISMKLVYQLLAELKENPERVVMTQALTLNKSKPLMGLKGSHGLFGSDEWWANIKNGVMPTLHISGVIQRAYVAGQEPSGMNNTVDLALDDGSSRSVGIYVNDEKDISLFRVGARAEILYALDELKNQPGPDGGVNYSKVAIEMAVSQ
ncbi:hypothetical protein SBX64_07670 [Vibrio rhizosphaerae]|uniref:Phage tail protein n=1 Tax=Vibrio rhizosphaerae TaxID=398736 RepID=A0ABU4IUJ1_9VIBR|nr:hypothetical protein [Vibrio rhizosphaerae]MDW6092421.1 hypothetical protein [Vibrio rhizosphaerae]